MGAVFSMFGGIYYWFDKITGVAYNEILGQIHFWIFFIGVNLTFFPMHFLGVAGMPRRVPDYPDAFYAYNKIASWGSYISAWSTLVFFFVLHEAFYTSKKTVVKSLILKNQLLFLIMALSFSVFFVGQPKIRLILFATLFFILMQINRKKIQMFKPGLLFKAYIGGIFITLLFFKLYLFWYLLLAPVILFLVLGVKILQTYFYQTSNNSDYYLTLFNLALLVFGLFMATFDYLLLQDLVFLSTNNIFSLEIELTNSSDLYYCIGKAKASETALLLTLDSFKFLIPMLIILDTPHTQFVVTTLFSIVLMNTFIGNLVCMIVH